MFIVFEGVEGVGKSTQAALLAERIENELKRDVILTREPGGTKLAETLRSLVLSRGQEPVDPRTEALVMAAARAHHISQVIAPSMRAEKFVVCDRFAGSFLAYQGYGRGLDLSTLEIVTHFASDHIEPDVTFHMSLDASAAMERKRGTKDRIEKETEEFFARVTRGFAELAMAESWVTLDASRPVEEIHEQIFAYVVLLSQSFGDK